MAPAEKGDGRKGLSAPDPLVTRELTVNIHKLIHGVAFKKGVPWALRESWKFATKEMGTPGGAGHQAPQSFWAKGVGNVPSCSRVPLPRKHNEHEDSPNKR